MAVDVDGTIFKVYRQSITAKISILQEKDDVRKKM